MNEQAIMRPDEAVTLGDKRVEISTFERFKGQKGTTYRLGVISPTLIRGFTYFYEGQAGKKMLFRAPTNPETLKFTKSVLGEPTQRFGLLIFQYLTDEHGEVLEQDKLRGKIKTWVISETRYEELSGIDRQWPLLDRGFDAPQHDLIAKCTEEQFQRMTFNPCPTAHWKRKQQWYEAIKAKESKAKEKLRWALGREMKDAEIMAMLGGSSSVPTASGDSAGDIDLSDVIEGDYTVVQPN